MYLDCGYVDGKPNGGILLIVIFLSVVKNIIVVLVGV